MEEVEEWMAFFQVYEGATYMNNGRTYIVTSLDMTARVATARGPVKTDYYTTVTERTSIETAAPLLAYPAWDARHDGAARSGARRLVAPPHFGPATVTKEYLGWESRPPSG
jgi:hypothetical protein